MDFQAYFTENRPLILFLYGQVFFVLGLAIFLQSRQRSRLRFARDLRWLAVFGILHGLHEWGLVFIPIQTTYLSTGLIEALAIGQVLLLALSFVCLFIFGSELLRDRAPNLKWLIVGLTAIWVLLFVLTRLQTVGLAAWLTLATVWARYLLGFPAAVLAAYGLYVIAPDVAVVGGRRFFNMLRVAGFSLAAYALVGGLIVPFVPFFPANTVNSAGLEALAGVPVEIFRSVAGLVLTISIIRALEIFDIETDRLIESMELDALRAAEQERIGQEIHDGALQGVYAVGLILNSLSAHITQPPVAIKRLTQAQIANGDVIVELRRYMTSLRTAMPERSLVDELHALLDDPRYANLVTVRLDTEVQPAVSPIMVGHLMGITREALANVIRHSGAGQVTISLADRDGVTTLEIADNGHGFDPAVASDGYGLQTIRERALLMGTTADVRSTPGQGTTITVPFTQSRERNETIARPAG
jgi:signal transduction histidine kinase